ncbi:MAG: hypothetical protein RSE00_01230 [Clostridia bacterium]
MKKNEESQEINKKENNKKLEENLKEIVKNISKQKMLTSQEQKLLLEKTQESVEFLKKINEIEVPDDLDRVIFIDGNEELVYEKGEFFICDTIDSKKTKKKIKRLEARTIYIEYFIRYQLNPIIKQKELKSKAHEFIKEKVFEEPVKSEIETKSKTPSTAKIKTKKVIQAEKLPEKLPEIENIKKARKNKEIEKKSQLPESLQINSENNMELQEKVKGIIAPQKKKSKKVEIREQDKIL